MRGEKLCFRGEFDRKPRVSLLCFIDVKGVTQVFDTLGTFDRHAFVQCCAIHAKSCSQYPGRSSVWVLDGASIHCHPDIVFYLRSVGIVPIFLPAYCPFFNPIEYVFGLVKKLLLRKYEENSKKDLLAFILGGMQHFRSYDISGIYKHCGYSGEAIVEYTLNK
ncbi:hypothetical protein Ae201684P_015392 [Aphanomyces euteiches]|nr:hypothetical protein Ae201684P_015392 [Aphanomyces euteiches]KAH9139195.1 hypothetical protein AeRB84_016528 [Aphanomyces euteiches]